MSNREEKRWRHNQAAKTMRSMRKEIKRNRKPKRVRRKDWNTYQLHGLDFLEEVDYSQNERVMPRGERERQRANVRLGLELLKREGDQTVVEEVSAVDGAHGQPGTVVEVSRDLCRVELGQRSLVCTLRGSLSAEETGYTNVVAVGDEVIISENKAGQGVVEAVLARRSVLARPDVFRSHLQQVVVANVDQLLIVASWREPHIWLELIDRYLIAAQKYSLLPVICVNKIDLAEDLESCRATLEAYQGLGYQVIFTSALTGNGVGALREALRRRTSVLAGLSGVGKSSLLAAVQPGLQLRVGRVNEQSGEGRHTTTQVVLHRLEMGGCVVDTPGMREFGLSSLRRGELANYYPEIAALATACHFGDCAHIYEPGCAVKEAVQQGQLPASRHNSYQKIYHSLPA